MTSPSLLPHRHVLTLPTLPAAVKTARRTAEVAFASWGISSGHPVMGSALLVLSELVTNSVRHAADLSPQVTVTYAAGPHILAFAVHDRHPHQPDLIGFPPGGGLATVVEVIADLGGNCVVRPDADHRGKSVWVTLPLQWARVAP